MGSAAFASGEKRRAGRSDRRSVEAARALKGALEQTVITELLPRSQIDVCVHVLVADGGVQAACINAAMLALAHAGPLLPPSHRRLIALAAPAHPGRWIGVQAACITRRNARAGARGFAHPALKAHSLCL